MSENEATKNWFAGQAEKEAKTDRQSASESRGQIPVVIGILIVLLFFILHQPWSTGFFASKFGLIETLLFCAPVLLFLVLTVARGFVASKNAMRPLETGVFILGLIAFVWFFVSFSFGFSHLADVLPWFLRFVLQWISDEIAEVILVLAILGTAFFIVCDAALYVYVRRELSKLTLP